MKYCFKALDNTVTKVYNCYSDIKGCNKNTFI